MNCDELVEVITDYLEGRLSSEEPRRFEDHLGKCPGCERYLKQMRLTIESLGKIADELGAKGRGLE